MSHEYLTLIKLPKEIIVFNILPFLKLTNIFELFSIENKYLQELLEEYMTIYMNEQKYKKSLQEALLLLEYEHFSYSILQFFNSYFYNLATTFISLVEEAGGSIHYHTLSLQEKPRAIYTINVIMQRNEKELLYKLTSAIFTNSDNKCISSFAIDNVNQSNVIINTTIHDIHTELICIFNMMGSDPSRKIKRIELNKELYQTGFAISLQSPEIVNISKYE